MEELKDLIGSTKRRGIKDDILKLREKNTLSYLQIKNKLKCSKGTINYHAKRYGLLDVGLKPQIITEELKNDIYNYTKENKIKDAVKHFNVSRATIVRYMFRKNLKTPEDKINTVLEYRKTHTIKETSEHFKISPSSIKRWSNRNN